MGCTPSKQRVCRNCKAQCSPVRHSYSSHPNRSPPRAVAPASTTLGYLLRNTSVEPDHLLKAHVPQNVPEKIIRNFTVEVVKAKLIDEKMNKIVEETPIGTPPDEVETINAWELMEGLDDSSPFHPLLNHISGFAFNTSPHPVPLNQSTLPSQEKVTNSNARFFGKKETTKEKLILYYTSLRGVRKTYEDCCHVRAMLTNYGFRVDERDVLMHSGFKDELKELLCDRYGVGGLPKVFIGRKYIGGADEIKRLHDECELDKVLEGCETVVDHGGGGGCGCEACGDIRFLPCETCSGSCKIYYEGKCEEGDDEQEENDYGFQRCPDCNENGLIRCPICCD